MTHIHTHMLVLLRIREECDEARRRRERHRVVSVCVWGCSTENSLREKSQTVDDAFSPQINRGKRQRNINKHAVVGVLEEKTQCYNY